MGTSAVAWFGTLRAQASGKDDLRRLLTRASGGMLFSTLQKFAPGKDGDINPVLTDRRNVVVIADEAHRSQYGFEESLDSEGRLKAGLAKHLRDALPGATVKIFYESRLEALVGAEARLDAIAADIVAHWENRRSSMAGKAMIATMSRHIAVTLYNKITALRPKWHSEDINKGRIKIVMTGSAAAPAEFQPHFHSKDERRDLKLRAKNPDDELEIVIVRDMWLTGFDAPSMHTMYVDKPMQGAGLMQAIARVNRRFKDKPGGLIVDYIGLFASLQQALSVYSPSDREQAGVPIQEFIDVMLEKHNVVRGILHGVTYDSSPNLPAKERLTQYAAVLDHVLSDPDLTARYNDHVLALAKAFALVASRPEAELIRNDVRLFTDVRAAVLKILNPDSGESRRGGSNLDTVLGQMLNDAVTADQVIDVFQFAGMDSPELSLLSDKFLDSVAHSTPPTFN